MKKKWIQNSIGFLSKILILAVAFIFLFDRFDSEQILEALSHPLYLPALLIPLFIVFWFINLWIDAFFWTRVHQMLENVSLSRGLKINLICYALSFITPANSGEWAGRYVMMSEPENRKKSFFLNFWMHLPRFFAKLLIVAPCSAILLYSDNILSAEFVLSAGLLSFAILVAAYFSFRKIQSWLHLRSFGRLRMENYLVEGRPETGEKLLFLILAGTKYLAYNVQFALILLLFSDGNLPSVIWLTIPVYYLVGSFIPSFAFADFVLKGAIAIWIFGPIYQNEALLILASVVIWFFNIVIPSFGGLYVIMKTNLFRSFKKKFSRGILNGL